MTKSNVAYVCTECGADFKKWLGQCSECNSWNSVAEFVQAGTSKKKSAGGAGGYAGSRSEVLTLDEISVEAVERFSSGLPELDRVLGGGLVRGSIVLIGGDPGVGKSTILLQSLCHLSARCKTLYISGEESLQQIGLRAERLGVNDRSLRLLAETQVEEIIRIAQIEKPQVMVIDSIQTMHTELLQAAAGSVSQVRESTAQLVRFAKQTQTAIYLIGHVTKDGAIAGPRVLEHMVDCVLYFEGQSDSRFRMIRAVKNRFGALGELGIFAMLEKGLKAVDNPSAIFLAQYTSEAPGNAITATWEGTRPLLVEVQALVDESHLGNPRRVTVGLDQNRLAMLLAVLSRHAGVVTYDQDVFVNAVGGIRVLETSADLAIVAAIISSLKNNALSKDIIFGEIGLAGEIRPVPHGQERLKEAAKLGFSRAIVPKGNAPKKAGNGIEVIGVDTLSAAVDALFT